MSKRAKSVTDLPGPSKVTIGAKADYIMLTMDSTTDDDHPHSSYRFRNGSDIWARVAGRWVVIEAKEKNSLVGAVQQLFLNVRALEPEFG
jgi:hypothetical protein